MVTNKRNPDRTRDTILWAAFTEIHQNGFRSASVDRILSTTGLTKGAMYHHFPNKAALGYAVVDEIIHGYILETWLRPLAECADPIKALISQLHAPPTEMVQAICTHGCPLNNLAQEMSPIDEIFRRKVESVFDVWRSGLTARLRRGQAAGYVGVDVDCEQAATFVVATVEGANSLAKNSRDQGVLELCADAMTIYLNALRPATKTAQTA